MSLGIIRVQAAANDSSINLKKDPGSDFFTLTIRDPDGIQEFSLSPVKDFRYGGLLSGCKKSFSNNNVSFHDPADFTPVMPAYVIDCKNNTTELEISPPVKGAAQSVLVKKEVLPSPAPSLPPLKEEKKEGPLSAGDIHYPVSGLGGCQNETECRSYCDNADRAKECFAFAKKYNLISPEKAKEAADQFLNVKNGPGGCNSGASCETYCNNVDHLDACITFAEESGYYSGDELAEAKKFQALVKAGKQFPGGCKERNACEIYCGDPDHMEECLNFAEESGFMPKEEIEQARKILPLMKRGETPGKCTSKEQCEQYCIDESHSDECIAFGEKAGFISPEDAAMIKKSGGKGPGGCRSKEQCESYCETNSDACFQWAEDNGLVSEDDLSKMKKGMSQFKEQLDKMPPEVTACLKDALGEKNFDKMVNGQPVFDRGMEGKMKSCFNQLTSQVSKQFNTLPPEAAQCIKDTIGEDGLRKLQSGEFDENMDFSSLEGCFQKLQSSFGGGAGGPGGPGEFAGPGGCKSIDECTAHCQNNPKECQQFAPPGGGGGKQHDGFSECGITTGAVAVYVCGVNGKGAAPGVETTYFNRCHAEQQGVQILHEGECNKQECSDIADPVCGNDGNSWTSACHAEKEGGGVKHKGVCTGEDGGQSGGGFPGGPGGCKSQEECTVYCKANQEDEACKKMMRGFGGGSGGLGGFAGPGGCKSQEECQAYCHANPNECQGFTPPSPSSSSFPGYSPSPHPQTQSCVPPPSGIVSWWNGDQVSGTTAMDSKDGNQGIISGGVTIVPEKFGNAFKFDGSSGYISMGNPTNLNFGTGPFSLETWFNWDGGGNSSALNIIRKSNYPVTGPGAGYWVRIGRDSKTIEFSVGATTGPEGQSIITAPISSGAWHHVAATRDSSGDIKLYVDGQSQGTILRQALNADATSEAPFTLGAWDDRFGVTERFSGLIDEVSLYNKALDASEVRNLFNQDTGACSIPSETPLPSGQPTPDYCSSFASVPSCSYVGSPESQNYQYCKQCYPNK